MYFRLAKIDDLPQLKLVFEKIIDNMNRNKISIWNEFYPYECFHDDIENNRLYILEEKDEIVAAFSLCESNSGEGAVKWAGQQKALYLDRFGVNVNYLRKGIGGVVLKKAITVAKERDASYLRLFVVDINEPAINLYIKNGFTKAAGIYDEVINDNLVLHEYGFEIETAL